MCVCLCVCVCVCVLVNIWTLYVNCSFIWGGFYIFSDPSNKKAVTLSSDDRPNITDTASYSKQ